MSVSCSFFTLNASHVKTPSLYHCKMLCFGNCVVLLTLVYRSVISKSFPKEYNVFQTMFDHPTSTSDGVYSPLESWKHNTPLCAIPSIKTQTEQFCGEQISNKQRDSLI